MKRLTLFAITCALAGGSLPAKGGCWVEPPEYRIQAVAYSGFFLRNVKSKKTVEVRRSQDFKLLWKAEIDDYNELFSEFRASPNGKFLVHIKGNHSVYEPSQVCVDVYRITGSRDSYKVTEFTKSLRENPPATRDSLSPRFVWLKEVREPDNEVLVIRLADGRYAWISLDKHSVEMHGEAEPDSAEEGSQPLRSETKR